MDMALVPIVISIITLYMTTTALEIKPEGPSDLVS
jgi:hypothetical protein